MELEKEIRSNLATSYGQSLTVVKYNYLVAQIRAAASRFEDTATIMDEQPDYDPRPFLKRSAERYYAVAKMLSITD